MGINTLIATGYSSSKSSKAHQKRAIKKEYAAAKSGKTAKKSSSSKIRGSLPEKTGEFSKRVTVKGAPLFTVSTVLNALPEATMEKG